MIENDLAAGLKEALKELVVLAREECWHHDVNGVADDLGLGVPKDLS